MAVKIHELFPTMRYRKAVVQMIVDFRPNVFITLAFNRDTNLEAARAKLTEFHKRLDKSVFGRNWWRRAESRSAYIAVVEHPDSNLHLHIALRLPPDRFFVVLGCAAKIWGKLVPSGSVAVSETYDVPRLAEYMTKEMFPPSTDRLLFSP